MLKHIEKIKQGRSYSAEDKSFFFNEIIPVLDSIKKVWDDLDLSNLKIHPYGYAVPFKLIYNNMRSYLNCTPSSRELLILEMNGCIDILNNHIDLLNEPKVSICIIEGKHTGEIRTLPKSIADSFVELDMAVYAEEVMS